MGNTRKVSATVASEALTRLRRRVNRDIRNAVGLSKEPPPRCNDPDEAYFALDSVARIIHGDLPPMLVGGLGSLFIQMLHPTPWPASPNIRATAKTPSGDSSRRRTSSASRPTARGRGLRVD